MAGNLNFKVRIEIWNIFLFEIGRFEKQITLSEKSHLYQELLFVKETMKWGLFRVNFSINKTPADIEFMYLL
jgi:hypothetical protein